MWEPFRQLYFSIIWGSRRRLQQVRHLGRVKYWKIITRNLKKRAWSLGFVSALIP
jgi:hypothetical protein